MLQVTNQFNMLVLALYIVLLSCVFIVKKQKVKLPKYYLLAITIYLFYLFIGIINGHENPFVDIKFQIFGFIFFFCIINLNLNYIKLLFFYKYFGFCNLYFTVF
jgi:hypothetical protein